MSKTAFLFPGQGAQTVGMGREVADRCPAAKALFHQAAEILGYDLLAVCAEGPVEKLNTTVVSQPALYVTSLAALETLKEESPEIVAACDLAAGLSLGEYTAMAFAGAISFEDGLKVVQQRGQAMQAAADQVASGMCSVLGLSVEQLEELCDSVRQDGEVLQIANLLCPGNTAISGHTAACQRMEPAAVEAGAMKVIPLAVAGAFHSPLMEPAVEPLTAALSAAEISAPSIPVISNVDAQPHTDADSIRSKLVRQVVQPVLWEKSLRHMLDEGITQFYEIGPGRVLKGLLKRVARKVPCESIIG